MSNENLNLAESAEVCKHLWEKYFASPKKDKPSIMKEYNEKATAYNAAVGFNCMTTITSSTKDSIKTRPVSPPEVINETDIQTVVAPQPEKKKGSIIEEIIALHKEGKTNKEIIALGYNKSTVGRQVSEYKKKLEDGKAGNNQAQ